MRGPVTFVNDAGSPMHCSSWGWHAETRGGGGRVAGGCDGQRCAGAAARASNERRVPRRTTRRREGSRTVRNRRRCVLSRGNKCVSFLFGARGSPYARSRRHVPSRNIPRCFPRGRVLPGRLTSCRLPTPAPYGDWAEEDERRALPTPRVLARPGNEHIFSYVPVTKSCENVLETSDWLVTRTAQSTLSTVELKLSSLL